MKIITDKFVFGGKSLGKIDGKNVFVPFGIPGEELEISITESKRDYDNAKIEKIIKTSPYRVKPACPYYEKCGGCNMMHIDSEYQKILRKQMLKDIFLQNGMNLSQLLQKDIQIVSGPDTNYRARFQFTDGGLSQRGTNNIIQISSCLCAEKPVNDFLAEKNENKTQSLSLKGRCHFFGSDFMLNNEEKIVIAEFEEKKSQNEADKYKINGKKKIKIKENHYFSGTVASPKNTVTVKINNKNLSFDVRGFFQSNLFVFEKVVQLICNSLPEGKNVLDMYAGCGSISTFLSDKFENVVLVEHNRDALVFAESNLMGKKHVSYGLSGENWVKNCSQFCGNFDACVVDPPRSGMEKAVRDYLCKSKIPYIIYLSCDPSTQARDLQKILQSGYKLDNLYLLDFYPNTSNIESLAVLSLII